MNEIIGTVNHAFTLGFVVTSMFGLGLGLTVRDLIAPLKNVRLVSIALAISFVLLPAIAWLLTRGLSLDQDLEVGLILMSTVAGAPLSIKAAQFARGSTLLAGSLVTLLVVSTVIYLPFALPLLVPGITIDAMAIALPLFLQVLLPLGFGMIMNARYDEEADMTRRIMSEIANISLAVMLILNLGNLPEVMELIGTGALASAIVIILAGVAAGYALGGPDAKTRRTLALSSAQRNYAAAFVIAQGSFAARPDVFLMLLAASLIGMVLVLFVASEFGRRARHARSTRAQSV